ncbi:hypothetical protein NVS47_09360 [Dehalobacterium formicoaceticum]|uniref:Uncharacterized protein n=1 Tax=Dehalobacterium formicoaceticum TaxID=51515 RepID=A0ABT1Y4A8_9FIRM|nr:DUF6765 family protein [Dehalobacterium formicoaceticum]MCR6545713.1 hypothetical protein [Dehalobacterium formicoaceticum]
MNIEFHYYAVKYLAEMAGFPATEAQAIAELSQFIDDSQQEIGVTVDPSTLPQEIKERKLYQVTPQGTKVFLPKTAVLSAQNTDYQKDLKNTDSQWKSLIPFHYFPNRALDPEDPETVNYTTSAIRNFADNDLFNTQLVSSIQQYKNEARAKTESSLLRIGILAHILGDSFSYTGFNGLESWRNTARLAEVFVPKTFQHPTADYKPEDLAQNPTVGHACVGSSVDDCGISGVFYHAADPNDTTYSATKTFQSINNILGAGRGLYHYFLLCQGKSPGDYENIWEATITPLLQELTDDWHTPVSDLNDKWQNKTGLTYGYDVNAVRQKIIKPENLYSFVIAVDDLRKCVKKTGPAVKLDPGDEAGTLEIGNLDLRNDHLKVTIRGQVEQTTPLVLQLSLKDKNFPYQQLTAHNDRFPDSSRAKVDLDIPFPKQEGLYNLQATLSDESKQVLTEPLTKNQAVLLESPQLLCRLQPLAPASLRNRFEVTVVNGFDGGWDISYLGNDVYKNAQGNNVLDIYLPVRALITLDKRYSFEQLGDYNLSLNRAGGEPIYHCKNPRFNHFQIRKDDVSTIEIGFDHQWQNQLPADHPDHSGGTAPYQLVLRFSADIRRRDQDDSIPKYRTIHWDSSKVPNQDQAFPQVVFKWPAL